MTPYNKPTISKKDLIHVLNCMITDKIEEGELTRKFEKNFAEFTGARDAAATASGTAALYLILRYLEIKNGDEIIISALAEQPVLEAIVHCGAVPVICDTAEHGYLIEPETVKSRITERTRAVILSHTFGYMCDVSLFGFLPPEIKIIEDCTHALGSRLNDRPAGLAGDFAFFSFNPGRIITCGQGGIILAKKLPDLYAVRDLRSPWGKEDCRGRLNFSFSDLLAAMALSELSLAEKFISRRREIGACYTSAVLRGKNHHLAPDENMQINFYCYPVLFASPVPEVISLFKKYKIEVRRPLPLPVYTLLKLPDEDFPLARNIWMKLAAVPIYPSLLKTEVETVSRLLQRIK